MNIPHDKLLHYFYGQVIFICMYAVFIWCNIDKSSSMISSFSIVLIVAIAKEVYDKVSGTGTPEIMDVVVTVCGAIIPILIVFL